MSRDQKKWEKIMNKMEEKLPDQAALNVGVEHWKQSRALHRKTGKWTEEMEEVFQEMKDAAENGDREKAEQLSSELRTRLKTQQLGGGS
ncbi:MAG: hypothetical protein ABEJ93_02775 [Candidatus Nanohalobium sp.]